MKKFKGRRKLDELIQIAESKGFEIDMQKFDKEGSDFIWMVACYKFCITRPMGISMCMIH